MTSCDKIAGDTAFWDLYDSGAERGDGGEERGAGT